MLGKLRQGGEVDFLPVRKRHLGVVAVVLLQMLGVVIHGEVEIVELRQDALVDDLHDVGLALLLEHLPHGRLVFRERHIALLLAEAAHHVGQVAEIDLVAGAVRDQGDAVAVFDFTAHRRDAHSNVRAIAGDFLGPHRAARDLLPIELADERAEPEEEHQRKEEDAPLHTGATTRKTEQFRHISVSWASARAAPVGDRSR